MLALCYKMDTWGYWHMGNQFPLHVVVTMTYEQMKGTDTGDATTWPLLVPTPSSTESWQRLGNIYKWIAASGVWNSYKINAIGQFLLQHSTKPILLHVNHSLLLRYRWVRKGWLMSVVWVCTESDSAYVGDFWCAVTMCPMVEKQCPSDCWTQFMYLPSPKLFEIRNKQVPDMPLADLASLV